MNWRPENSLLNTQPARRLSPFVLCLRVLAIAWTSEAIVMVILAQFPHLSEYTEAVADASLMGALMLYPLWRWVLAPFRLENSREKSYLNQIDTQRAEFQALFENMQEGFVVQHQGGAIQKFNQAALDILGLSADELHGRTSLDPRWKAIREDGSEFPGSEHPAMLALRTGKAVRSVIMGIHRKDGSLHWIAINATPIFEPESSIPARVLTTFANVTEQRETTRVLHENAKLAGLGTLAAGVAHEINNPLAIIQAKAEKLLRVSDGEITIESESVRTDLQKILATVARIAAIVRGLRAFAQSDERVPRTLISAKYWIQAALDPAQERCHNLSVSLTVEPIPEVSTLGQSQRLGQALSNLLANAIDAATEDPSPERWIAVRFRQSDEAGGRLVVQVINSGKPIPPESIARLMEPFFTTKPVGKGTGLGLASTKGIMESHGGSVRLNTTHANTCFELSLPILSSGTESGTPPQSSVA